MTIHMNLGEDSYDIIVERGALAKANEYLNLNRRVLVVTDSGVPSEYASAVAAQCKESVICTVESGEGSKSLETFGKLLKAMLDNGFSRKDCVVAVGGGVVGDLSGFVASAYMRGIDFYNIPTTLLSQIDSSIGGKTAINLVGVKNIVGAFYQPKRVIIDPELLKTLSPRQISSGLAEAVKMALTSDKELFDIFESCDMFEFIFAVESDAFGGFAFFYGRENCSGGVFFDENMQLVGIQMESFIAYFDIAEKESLVFLAEN